MVIIMKNKIHSEFSETCKLSEGEPDLVLKPDFVVQLSKASVLQINDSSSEK